jgi:phosphoesterase RecJ-like protein
VISVKELALKLRGETSVALICHIRPDGDALGSAFALSKALQLLGISAVVACDDTLPSRFFFLNVIKELKTELDGEYSAMIAMDCADITRLGKFANAFSCHKNTYVIDHHVSNPRYAKINYVFDNASNCENVFDIIKELGVEVDEETANLLMLGLMTDTGGFKHKNVTAKTFEVASFLKDKGADTNAIYYHAFTKQSKNRAVLFGKTMSKIRYLLDDKLAIATIRLADVLDCGAEQSDTEGFVDFVMGIDGVEVGVCILEMVKDKYKISLRSKGKTNVNAVAATFGGGGHVLASGCQIAGEYEEVVDKIRFAVSRELPE